MDNLTVNQAVALRTRELMNKHNMSKYKLERISTMSHGRVSCILQNKNKTTSLSSVMLIANTFGMTVQEFLNSPLFNFDNLEVD